MAGEVIVRVSGMSYEAFVQKRIIEPLQMDSTFIGNLVKDKSNLATPHSSESGTIKIIDAFRYSVVFGSGGMSSAVADMAKWMIVV